MNANLAVEFGDRPQAEVIEKLEDELRAGRLISSAAKQRPGRFTGLGIYVSSFSEAAVTYTWNGDSNIDRIVNADDYFLIDSNFIARPEHPRWGQGDFNYDGLINADDYFLIDAAFIAQTGPLGVSGIAAAPEPTVGTILVTGILGLMGRRRRGI